MAVNLIAAVGRQGQLGLGGQLPWHRPEDLKWFRKMTTGTVMVCGRTTYETIKHLDGTADRTVICQRRDQTCADILAGIDRDVSIVGGASLYKVWLDSGLVDRSFIAHIDYDGPADVYMPPLWQSVSL